MLYNPSVSGHPYAPESSDGDSPTGGTRGDKGPAEKALDCVSESSSSSSSTTTSSSSSSSSSAASSSLSTSTSPSAFSSSCSHHHHHRHHHHHCHSGEGRLEAEGSQGLWASGGTLCSCPQHSISGSALDSVLQGRYAKECHGFSDDSVSVSSAPVIRASTHFPQDGSHFFRGNAEGFDSCAAAAPAYVGGTAPATPTGTHHTYNHPRQQVPCPVQQQQQTPPRGRQQTSSPLPPRPRCASAGASTPSHAAAPSSLGFMRSPAKNTDLGGSPAVGGAGGPVHLYQVGSLSDGGNPTGAVGSCSLPQHHRQSSVSSNHSAAGSGRGTPPGPPKPPRHPSEERAHLMTMWVDIPPSPLTPFVPTHLESQRRRTPRKSSAPPSPATSTLAASVSSSPQGQSMPVPPPQGSSFSNGSDVDGYGCPPPLPERVPLTSPTASVSSASPDVSQSSLLLLPRARKSSGGAAEGAAGTTTAMTTATAGDPPGGPTEPGTERSPVTSHPPERHAVSFMRVDVPPKPTPMHALAPPAAAPDKRGATGNDTQGAVQPPSPRSRDAHSLDAALHTRVALPPPLSIHHRSLFSKPTTTTTTTATDDDNASLCRSPPCQTTSTGATGPPPRYTERQEVMRPAPREEADDASCGLLSPASPVSCSALATEGVADAVDLVSSPSEGEDGGQEGEEEEEADVPTTTTTTTADDEVLERIMGAVKRAKERVAKRTMQ